MLEACPHRRMLHMQQKPWTLLLTDPSSPCSLVPGLNCLVSKNSKCPPKILWESWNATFFCELLVPNKYRLTAMPRACPRLHPVAYLSASHRHPLELLLRLVQPDRELG